MSLQREQILAGLCVPDLRIQVVAAGDDPLTVRGERRRSNGPVAPARVSISRPVPASQTFAVSS